jgi:hypothetical protein
MLHKITHTHTHAHTRTHTHTLDVTRGAYESSPQGKLAKTYNAFLEASPTVDKENSENAFYIHAGSFLLMMIRRYTSSEGKSATTCIAFLEAVRMVDIRETQRTCFIYMLQIFFKTIFRCRTKGYKYTGQLYVIQL